MAPIKFVQQPSEAEGGLGPLIHEEMMMIRKLVSLFCFCATVLLASQPALANLNARATFGPLTVQLSDLDPFDGIAPALTFVPNPAAPTSKGWVAAGTAAGTSLTDEAWAEFGDSLSVARSTAVSSAAASFHWGGGNGSGSTASASANAELIAYPNQIDFGASVQGIACSCGWGSSFVLTPHTRVTFSGLAEVSAQMPFASIFYGSVSSYSGLILNLDGVSGVTDGASAYAYVNPGTSSIEIGSTGPQSKNVSVFADNDTSSAIGGGIEIWLTAGGYAAALPVPEPDGWVLISFGLATLAFLNRRRRVGA